VAEPSVLSTDGRKPRKSEHVGERLAKLMQNAPVLEKIEGVQPLSQGFFLHQQLRKSEHPKQRSAPTKLRES
jgi:hypothetical protein